MRHGPAALMAPADTYTHGHADSVLTSHRWRTAANSAAYLLPHLRPGLRLLDVGCGPGTLTVDLATQVAPGPAVAVDMAVAPLAEARAHAAAAGVTVGFLVGDLYGLPAADASYDVVHAHQVLQHVSDPVRGLVEMGRVVRPDGVIAVRDVDYAATTWFPEIPALDAWLELYHRVARRNHGEPDAGRRLLSWGQAAGLTPMSATVTAWCYATPAERTWWGESWAQRATTSSFGLQALEYGLATQADLDHIAAGWLEWAAAPDGWIALVHGELLLTR